jgi:hypothetical protein
MGLDRPRLRKYMHLALCSLAAILIAWPGTPAQHPLPLTAGEAIRRLRLIPAPASAERSTALPDFAASMANGRSDQVVGVYAPGLFALQVQQQPATSPAYVSSADDAVTQFGLAMQYGTIGLLAHNYLAGESFFDLRVGTPIAVVYGDGAMGHYVVVEIERYRALRPSSPYSDFLPLDGQGGSLSSTELFYHTYAGDGELVFQTCIAANGNPSWGRYFVTAMRVQSPFIGRFVHDFGARPIAFH